MSSSAAAAAAEEEDADVRRFCLRPEVLSWRARANDQRCPDAREAFVDFLRARGSDEGPEAARATAVDLFILMLASCPDLVDAQVVALATLYLDRYICGGGDRDHRFAFRHIAAACMALALKWEHFAADDVVGWPRDAPSQFNRLIEVFQAGCAVPLTPRLLHAVQFDVFVRLDYCLWLCTPTEWMCLVRNTGPASFVESPLARSTDPLNQEEFPPPCWLRRAPSSSAADALPQPQETAAALARLPLEEQVLLHALREPALVAWSPCRLATACLAAARPELWRALELARLGTMPGGAGLYVAEAAAKNTGRDARCVLGLFAARAEGSGRVPPLAATIPWAAAGGKREREEGGKKEEEEGAVERKEEGAVPAALPRPEEQGADDTTATATAEKGASEKDPGTTLVVATTTTATTTTTVTAPPLRRSHKKKIGGPGPRKPRAVRPPLPPDLADERNLDNLRFYGLGGAVPVISAATGRHGEQQAQKHQRAQQQQQQQKKRGGGGGEAKKSSSQQQPMRLHQLSVAEFAANAGLRLAESVLEKRMRTLEGRDYRGIHLFADPETGCVYNPEDLMANVIDPRPLSAEAVARLGPWVPSTGLAASDDFADELCY